MTTTMVVVAVGGSLLVAAVALLVAVRSIVEPPTHEALVLSGPQRRVAFGPVVVPPFLYRVSRVDLRIHPLTISRRARESLHARDHVRIEVDLVALVRVSPTRDDVLRVHEALGERANDLAHRHELLARQLTTALKHAIASADHRELALRLDEVRDRLRREIGTDLAGFAIADVFLVHLAHAPRSAYDPANVQDAEGLRVLAGSSSS